MKSIRSYLLTRLLGGSALVLAGAGLAVYLVVTRSLAVQFDENLANRAQGLESLLFQEGEHVEFEFSGQLMPEYERESDPAYFELSFQDGTSLEQSESLREGHLLVQGTPSREPAHWTAPLPDGREGRFVSQLAEVHHIFPEEGPGRPTPAILQVVVAEGLEELLATERRILFDCAAIAVALMAMIAVLSWIALERGLAPVRRLAETLDAVQVEHLPEGLDAGELPCELEPVAQKADALIRRLDAALERERRTTADIAHELRTPISEVLTVSEVALRNGKDVEGARRALATMREVAWRMGHSLSTLLKLARLEMGAESFEREAVDLGGIVAEALRAQSDLTRERELRIENLVEGEDVVEGDREALRIVVSNLLSNALYYSPHRGIVECRVDRSEEGWRLTVENDAADLRPADMRLLSEPFWRKDRSRTERDRSGLGLALSQTLAEKTGMRLSFALESGRLRAILASDQESFSRRTRGRGARPPDFGATSPPARR